MEGRGGPEGDQRRGGGEGKREERRGGVEGGSPRRGGEGNRKMEESRERKG